MKCSFCPRQSVHEFESMCFCESCGKAFREGFEKGRVYESISRREKRRRKE